MISLKKKSKIAILIASIVVIFVGTFAGVKLYENNNYKKYINEADSDMSAEKYDAAIDLYNKALSYKNDSKINKKIVLVKILKSSKESYDAAINEMKEKKYLDAINDFKEVNKQDSIRYNIAQSNIIKCTKEYIAANIESAKTLAKNKKYSDAITLLNNNLKIDSSNNQSQNLKNDYSNEIKNQQTNQEEKNKTENDGITKDKAIQMVKQLVKANCKYQYDHDETHNSRAYYIIHVYESATDHTATLGWYAVDKNNGKIYDFLLDSDYSKALN